MKIYDLTLTIHPDLPVWPGDPQIQLPRVSRIEDGEVANVTRLDISAHTGTHVDAPFHFLRNGSTVETLDLGVLTGPAYVTEFTGAGMVSAADLDAAQIPEGTVRLLIKTRNSEAWEDNPTAFDVHYIAVDADAAQWLVDQGVKLVGVDYLSVAPYDDVIPTHVTLLEAGVIIVEGLNLSRIEPGTYQFICLPLKIGGADGAPARAILIEPTA